MNPYLLFICSVSAMGGLLFGYDWVVIGGAKPFYEQFFDISQSPVLQGVAMTTALIGCLFGAMTAGAAADRYGRKPLLIASAILFTVSAIATGLFNDFTLFNTARFIGGVGIGVASALAPMYIAEVSPAHIRGRMVSLNQMTIVLGILAAQIVNMLLARDTTDPVSMAWNLQWGWRWMFWAETLPAALFLVMSFFIPESPVFLQLKAEKAKTAGPSQPHSPSKATLGDLFTARYARVLLLGLVIAVFQQWCGTNVIFNYAQEIFQSAGYSVGDVLFNIVITGVANVLFTLVAIFTIDKLGRRKLMLLGAGGLCIIYATLGCCYYMHITGFFMIILVVAAIACYAMTLGPCTWVLISELFPNRVRAIAVATCTFALWVGSSTLTYTFPMLNKSLGSYGTFWIYALVCGCGYLFFFRRLPETKGKSLEQLEKELVKSDNESSHNTTSW